jgi:uncharacterized protein (TIGR04255 family)
VAFGPDIPEVDHEVFPNPPLKAMLGQVRFPPVLRIADLASLAPFQDAIRNDFPDFSPEQQFSVVLGPEGPHNVTTSQAYRFGSPDHAWSVLLATEAMTIEADPSVRYTSYDEFATHFARVWEAALEHFSPSQVVRQGLRYTDHIEGDHPAVEWRKYINEDLLGPLVGAFGDGVSQSVSELRFSREDGVLVFKHGMLPAGPKQTMGYLLDFDYFVEQPNDDVSVEAVMSRFDGYHEVLYAFFRWCVTEDALKEFRCGD